MKSSLPHYFKGRLVCFITRVWWLFGDLAPLVVVYVVIKV